LTPYTVIKCCVLTHPPDIILIFDIVITHNGDEPLKESVVICCVSGCIIYFGTLFLKEHDFSGKSWLNIKFMFWISLQLLSRTFLIVRRIQQTIVTNAHSSSCKLPLILARFQWNLSFRDRFSKNSLILNFMKFLLMGAELFHLDVRTDTQTDRHTWRG